MSKYLLIIVVSIFLSTANSQIDLPQKPNVVFIVMDDFDVLDMTKYKELYYPQSVINNLDMNLEIKTPNLDHLFDDSVVFSNFYTNGANCAPTRGSLLTGLFPSDLGFYRAVPQDSERGIYEGIPFLTEVLKQSDSNYQTSTVGKWNVGHKSETSVFPLNPDVYKPQENGFDYAFCTVGCNIPSSELPAQGYDEDQVWDIGNVFHRDHVKYSQAGVVSYQFTSVGEPPTCATDSDENVLFDADGVVQSCDPSSPYNDDNYLTELNTQKALNRITTFRDPSKPFFLNLWYWLPHGKSHVPLGMDNSDGDYNHYKMRYDKPVPDSTPHQVDENGTGCDDGLDINGDVQSNFSETAHNLGCNTWLGEYAAMVTRLDDSIGTVIDEAKKIPNTLIIVVSDNGGAIGEHVLREDYTHPSGNKAFYGKDSNIVFNGSKNEVYERGIRAPMMVYWTEDLNPDTNNMYANRLNARIVDDMVLSREMFSTLAKLTGVQLPNSSQYGKDIVDILKYEPNQTTSESYQNNHRTEWLTSENRPVFYENNYLNRPNYSFVTAENDVEGGCNGDNEGEYQDYAVVQGDWKYVYGTSYWEDESECVDKKEELFKMVSDADGKYETFNELSIYPHTADYLKLLRKRWHQSIGLIEYLGLPSDGSELTLNNSNDFDEIDFNERLNIAEGHFSFSVNVNPSCGVNSGISEIASRQKTVGSNTFTSWRMHTDNYELKLHLTVTNKGLETTVSGDKLEFGLESGASKLICGQENHLAFTIVGGRAGGPMVRLFLNGDLVSTRVMTDENLDPPQHDPSVEWVIPDSIIKKRYIMNLDSGIRIGGHDNDSMVGTISQPIMFVNPFTNEDIKLQAAHSANETSFQNSIKNYEIELKDDATYSDAKFDFYANDTNNPFNEDYARLETINGHFGEHGDISFSARLNLEGDQPQNNSIIGRQVDTQNANDLGWIFKLVEITPGSSYRPKLTIYPENDSGSSCSNGSVILQNTSESIAPEQFHQVGFNVHRTVTAGIVNSTARLYLNGKVIDSQDLGAGCRVKQGNVIFLGNRYDGCTGNNCDIVKGTMDQVQVEPVVQHTQYLGNISGQSKHSGRIISFSNLNQSGSDNPYAVLSPISNFNAVNKRYNFFTVANLMDDDLSSHATLARQYRVNGTYPANNSRGHSWILKYARPAASSTSHEVKLNIWFKSGANTECRTDVFSGDEKINSFEEHHVGFTVDESNVKLYLDGKEVGSAVPCGDELIGASGLEEDHIILGDQFEVCDTGIKNDPACYPFNGYIYTPKISTQVIDNDYVMWDGTYNYLFE